MGSGSALHQHRGTPAVQRMVEYAPSTGGLALWVKHQDLPADAVAAPGAPPVATDGHTVFYAAAFERLPVAAQAGWVAHEVLHIALRHPQRYLELQQRLGEVDLPLFNLCADAIVNSTLAHLGWLQLPPGAVLLDHLLARVLAQDTGAEAALLLWDVESLYRAVDDRRPPPDAASSRRDTARSGRSGGGQGEGQGGPGQGAGQDAGERAVPARVDGPRAARARALGAGQAPDLQPGPATAAAPEDAAEQAREWRERVLRGHAGDGEFSMLRALLADLPRTRTPWEQVLRTRLARGLALRPALSWSRPSRSYLANQGRAGPHRRMPWEPGISPVRPAPRLALIVDVSGSIDDALLQRFAREVEAIVRRQEAALVLIVGDDQVRQVTHFEPGRARLDGIACGGGGGTDFTPLLEEAARHRPDLAVVLTDLDGPARQRPRWPVIWAVPESHAAAVPPFGTTLVLA